MKDLVSSVKPVIHEFVDRFFGDETLGDDDDMFATGYVNSMFALQLVQFVEAEFGITVESDDLDLDNFRTVSSIAAFVDRKTGRLGGTSETSAGRLGGTSAPAAPG